MRGSDDCAPRLGPGSRESGPLLEIADASVDEFTGRFSPNGRWIAFAKDENARQQVFIRSFPDTEFEYPVSTTGGSDPTWSGDGRTLFYRRGSGVWRVSVSEDGGRPSFGPEEEVFDGNFRPQTLYFDHNPATTTFVMVAPRYEQRSRIVVARQLLATR